MDCNRCGDPNAGFEELVDDKWVPVCRDVVNDWVALGDGSKNNSQFRRIQHEHKCECGKIW